jgi:hypothetical protein
MGATRSRLIAVLLAVLLATGCGAGSASEARGDRSTPPAPPSSAAPTTTAPATPTQQELPGGGTQVFPGHRLVGFSGAPSTPALGRLTGDLTAAAEQLRRQAVPYGVDRPVLPTFELIATVALSTPGPSGDYASTADDATVQAYLDAARAAGAILLLGIQPGTGDFLPAVQHYERWLTEPDVGLALDPEWAVQPGQHPGDVFGSTTGAELDSVSAYLDGLVTGVALVKSVDGIGAPADKIQTYQRVIATLPPFVHAGFKLFYDEDTRSGPLMDPGQVLGLVPQPEYVLYE